MSRCPWQSASITRGRSGQESDRVLWQNPGAVRAARAAQRSGAFCLQIQRLPAHASRFASVAPKTVRGLPASCPGMQLCAPRHQFSAGVAGATIDHRRAAGGTLDWQKESEARVGLVLLPARPSGLRLLAERLLAKRSRRHVRRLGALRLGDAARLSDAARSRRTMIHGSRTIGGSRSRGSVQLGQASLSCLARSVVGHRSGTTARSPRGKSRLSTSIITPRTF
jgi:hypothetical protein